MAFNKVSYSKRTKLRPRAMKRLFIGYAEILNTHRLLHFSSML